MSTRLGNLPRFLPLGGGALLLLALAAAVPRASADPPAGGSPTPDGLLAYDVQWTGEAWPRHCGAHGTWPVSVLSGSPDAASLVLRLAFPPDQAPPCFPRPVGVGHEVILSMEKLQTAPNGATKWSVSGSLDGTASPTSGRAKLEPVGPGLFEVTVTEAPQPGAAPPLPPPWLRLRFVLLGGGH